MNHQDTNNRIRPGILALAACALLVTLIAFGIYWLNRTEPIPTTASGETTVEPATALPPAPAVESVAAGQPVAAARPSPVEEHWGIQVSSIRLTRADSAVDLRYKVVAPEKVALLASDENTAYLIDQASGAKIQMLAPPQQGAWPTNVRARTVAKMMRQAGEFPPAPSRLVAGKTYSLLLPNPGGTVKSGTKVVLVVGNYPTDALTVE